MLISKSVSSSIIRTVSSEVLRKYDRACRWLSHAFALPGLITLLSLAQKEEMLFEVQSGREGMVREREVRFAAQRRSGRRGEEEGDIARMAPKLRVEFTGESFGWFEDSIDGRWER